MCFFTHLNIDHNYSIFCRPICLSQLAFLGGEKLCQKDLSWEKTDKYQASFYIQAMHSFPESLTFDGRLLSSFNCSKTGHCPVDRTLLINYETSLQHIKSLILGRTNESIRRVDDCKKRKRLLPHHRTFFFPNNLIQLLNKYCLTMFGNQSDGCRTEREKKDKNLGRK